MRTTEPQYDVAIVGASISGCTAATLYARRGLNVALIERRKDPSGYKKICTHFIQASATPVIQRLGLASMIEEAGGLRNGVEFWTRWGWIRPETSFYGYNIRREKLDPMMRGLASSTPRVDFLPGTEADKLIFGNGRVTGVTVHNGESRDLTARLIVGADGYPSRIAELSGLPAKVQPNNRFGYWAYYRNVKLTAMGGRSQLWFLHPSMDIAYTFPNDDGLTILACMPVKTRLDAFKKDLEGSFTEFFKNLPDGPEFEEADRVTDFLGLLEVPNVIRPSARPGLSLIGDASLRTDPLFGLGCGWAFHTAEWLVDSTADALLSGQDEKVDRGLEEYMRIHRSILGRRHSQVTSFSTGRGFKPIERILFSAAAKDTAVAQALGGRDINPAARSALGALARSLWVNLTRRGG